MAFEIGIITNSMEMYSIARELQAKEPERIDTALAHTYPDSLVCARDMVARGVRIIIARGGHSAHMRESELTVPIVDITLSGSGIVSLMIQARKAYGRFAVVGSSDLVERARELDAALGYHAECYEIRQWESLEAIIAKVKESGIRAIVGGYDASRFAEAAGLDSICVTSSRAEMETALAEAKKVLSLIDHEKQWKEMFQAVQDSIREGIVIFDEKGNVSHVNDMARRLLASGEQLQPGGRLRDESLRRRIEDTLRRGARIFDELHDGSDYRFTISIFPINMDGRVIGAVMLLQELAYVKKIEQKISQRLSQRGLVAKHHFDDILGTSEAIHATINIAKQYSIINSTVLISGESGTGKEMFAQSIHNYSQRKDGPFVAINCATIPPNLLESELFGYAEGAFTGAKKGGKMGLFELASGGTIFLDEIGEMRIDMQARMLRVLEERQIMRIGDDRMIPVDIRVIAATNKDLRSLVEEGAFREDFFYRLNVLSLNLPPLRERTEDLAGLIESFISRYSRRHERSRIRITAEGMAALMDYSWPGNARELKNVVERLVVTSRTGVVGAAEAEAAMGRVRRPSAAPAPKAGGADLKKRSERELIARVLRDTAGNKTEAARRLGVSRPTLYRKIREMGLEEV